MAVGCALAGRDKRESREGVGEWSCCGERTRVGERRNLISKSAVRFGVWGC